MQVEVKQIGKTECFIKVFSEHKQGGFVMLMEAIESLELQVVSANFTAFNGRVQIVIEVKVRYQQNFCFVSIILSRDVSEAGWVFADSW